MENKKNDLFFQITPEDKLSFEIESDSNTPISIASSNTGTISIDKRRIEYTPIPGFSGIEILHCDFIKNGAKALASVTIRVGYSFKAKSHILSLLGDELIGSDNLAIFELVKNAYDADAEKVTITLNNLNTPSQSIIIEDDGSGMTLGTLKNVWLEIGTDFKRGIKRSLSPRFNRTTLGEKGVGRLAIHKLGKNIILETKTKTQEITHRIELNWAKLIEDSEFIGDTMVDIKELTANLFPEKGHGTRITISELKTQVWSKKDLRDLARKTKSIISPFTTIHNFNVEILANDYHQEWFEDIKDPIAILNDSLYSFDFAINEKAEINWNYNFNPPKQFGIQKNKIKSKEEDKHIRISNKDALYEEGQIHLHSKDLNNIGPFTGKFYVFNLLSVVVNAFGQTNAIKSFVKANSGVKIFRDGIRVYNYGEPGDDWLGLDLARVQKLGEKFSKNTVVGVIEIDMTHSHNGLIEKTNREGFDDNLYYKKFRAITNEIFDLFQRIAIPDREKIKHYLENIKPTKKIGLSETIKELEEKLKEKKLDKELAPILKRVEKDYNDMRDVMVNSGLSGMNLGVVFHEVDREIRFINTDLNNNSDLESIKERIRNLIQLLENFSPLLKQNKNIIINASGIINRAKQINNPRLIHHKIIFSSPVITNETADFQIKGPGNLLLSVISNVIDNAIYWVSAKRELESNEFKPAIYIGSDITNFSGPALVIADNGLGFNLEPEDLILPFRTTRPGGMGLGLYFVNIVMEMIGGKLLFPDREELNIPKSYNGAVIVLVFPK
jgi:signal transduction histidine kinase